MMKILTFTSICQMTIIEEIYDNYSVMNLLNDSRESKNAALIVPWAKIYRKEILNDLHFPLARTGEDALFNLKVFLKSEKIVYIHKGSYIYRHRGESLSRNWTVDWFNESLFNSRGTIINVSDSGISTESL